MDFSGHKSPEHRSSGRDFKSWVWDFRLLKESYA
jgi:hypothetical protein